MMDRSRCFSTRMNDWKECWRWGYNRPFKKKLSVGKPKFHVRKGKIIIFFISKINQAD